METAFLIFRLRPFHSNLKSRAVKTPKLFFYDTGLACALLGISKASQLSSHPLRGALFENWVVSEALKARLHRGLDSGGHFLRDRKGFEIDLLVDVGDRLIATEIKSGQTIAGDYFTNLERLAKWQPQLFGERNIDSRVVYGGRQRQRRRSISVVPWSEVRGLKWW